MYESVYIYKIPGLMYKLIPKLSVITYYIHHSSQSTWPAVIITYTKCIWNIWWRSSLPATPRLTSIFPLDPHPLLLVRHGREFGSPHSDSVKMVVNEGNVCHDTHPLWVLHVDHILHVLQRRDEYYIQSILGQTAENLEGGGESRF